MSLKYIILRESYPSAQFPLLLKVKLDRTLSFHPHLEALHKKLSACFSLMKATHKIRIWCSAKTPRTAALALVYSTAKYCAPVWCRSAHTCLIDSVQMMSCAFSLDACILFQQLLVLSGIQPVELCPQGATLPIANHGYLDPDHIFHG